MEKNYFPNLNLDEFWDDDELALKEYVDDTPNDLLIASVEDELGYTLPASYVAMMKKHNGGIPFSTCYPLPEDAEEDYVEITGFLSIGKKKMNSLCGTAGNKLFKEVWHYPDYGVYICDCPSAGFDLILLDYRECGEDGEPSVAHVDIETGKITTLAPDFVTFIENLTDETAFIDPEEDKAYEVHLVEYGNLSPLLSKMCVKCGLPDAELWIRSVARHLVEKKGFFGLHEDELSWHMYDLEYLLYSFSFPKATVKQYLHDYPLILAEDGEFTTNGYAPAFVADWMEHRTEEGKLIQAGIMPGQKNCLVFTTEAMLEVVNKTKEIVSLYDMDL